MTSLLRNKLLFFVATSFAMLFMACSSSGGDSPAPPAPDIPLLRPYYILVPLGGNAYVRSDNTQSGGTVTTNGISWSNRNTIIDVYFHSSKAFNAKLVLDATATNDSELRVTVLNKTIDVTIPSTSTPELVEIGDFYIDQPGYVKVSLGPLANNSGFPRIISLGVAARSPDRLTLSDLNFVREDFSFHFGRRGPSVHLGYQLPSGDIEWFYNEVTIEPGNEVLGSYYMANGSSQGYFGMQVNSLTERRILFSIWAPYDTDDPNQVPPELRMELLEKGDDVITNTFGGEGSGGQSYLIYPWQAGVTYRFLKRVRPIGGNNTVYTAYFFDPNLDSWRLIASFRRPSTNTWYTGAYSFLENFHEHTGQFTRRGLFGNQWARTTTGEWIEVRRARYTIDATGNGNQRLDYKHGIIGNRFYLQNCGFFNDNTPNAQVGQYFERPLVGTPPNIDFSQFN
jgi:hypothetical protein